MAVQALDKHDLTSIKRAPMPMAAAGLMNCWERVWAFLLCLGTALTTPPELQAGLCQHGGWLSILLAVVLSASCLLIVNPQNYSAPLVINC